MENPIPKIARVGIESGTYFALTIVMHKKIKNTGLWTGVPPWIFIGAAAVLLPIFTFVTISNIQRQKENSIRLMLEKGAALIRSFEAGTRTGMMGRQWGEFQLQKLLTETAQQPDILYLLVSDSNGIVRAHNDSSYIGREHGEGLDLERVSRSKDVVWRIVSKKDGRNVFEIFRRFSPTGESHGMGRGRMMMHRMFQEDANIPQDTPPMDLIIFVGLDMSSIEAAGKADTRHAVIMGVVLLLIGLAGITLLFLAQSYRATRASLSRIKAFSDNLVENMPIGLLAIDPDKNIASFNHVAGSVLSLPVGEVIGKEAENILPKALWKQIANLDSAGGVIEKEIDCRVDDGNVIPLEISATVLNDEAGTFLGYVLLFKDLTEVRYLRKEIARSQRLVSVGKLAAGVAHEIRNPLSSLKGFATYFKERYVDIPENLHVANIMIQEVDRLNRVVGQLLDLAKPVTVSKKTTQVRPLIEATLKLAEPQILEKRIKTDTRISPETDTAHLDPDKMSQVLLNLYLNAVEAMDAGENLSVIVARNAEMNGVEIRISDSGAGISQDDLAHVFDPYFTTKSSGTGLGLAIV
ncbi:MAG: PAS domain-containing protein, partial [Deltaproteobacteria bacterium]|nr:PAS domain-containing protein [Deltaproteobacteria bacterium]